jgi:hypothetical protein
MPEHTMQEEFRLDREWWLPSWHADRKIRGYVKHSPQFGIRLETEGSLEDAPKFEPGLHTINLATAVLPSYEIVHGLTADKIPVTLVEAIGLHPANFPLPVQQANYRVGWLIIGEHVSNLTDWKYAAIYVRHHNLEEFIGRFPFSISDSLIRSGQSSIDRPPS